MDRFDVIVIGAGIAGASVAAELAPTHKVVLLEAESHPGYHSTGRSAALFSETYGNATIRRLSQASRSHFFDPPQGFCESPLVRDRGVLFVAGAGQVAQLDAYHTELSAIGEHALRMSAKEALALCPVLRSDYVAAGLHEPLARDVDVHALHQGYLRQLRRLGGRLVSSSRVSRIERNGDGWIVVAAGAQYQASLVINAAGAWADEIAGMAGVSAIGLRPCRRTALLVNAPARTAIETWPLVVDIEETFYFKPDAGLILISPADETPVEPSDVQPDEWDVAVAIDRIGTATTLDIHHVKHKWAGLRSFVEDRTPVVGFDADVGGFFWLAAQGGYGVQTAPALSRLAAALVRGEAVPADIAALGVDAGSLAPDRLRRA